MQRTSFLTVSLFLLLSACSGKTLDGGSTGDTAGAGTGQGAAKENESGEIPDGPVAGRIAGRAFETKTVQLAFSKRNNQWFFNVTNYENDCGTNPSGFDGTDAMTVNIGGVEPSAGTFVIEYGDGHGASLQYGVFDESKESDTRAVQSGTFRLDNWDETPGATITGGLRLVADDESAVGGTFTAKVCAPR